MKSNMGIFFAAGLLLATTAPAHAVVRNLVFTGNVTFGFDDGDRFGLNGGSFEGQAFTAVFTYDTSKGTRITTPSFDLLTGGTNSGTLAPLIHVTLTINGRANEFGGRDYSEIYFGSFADDSFGISVISQQDFSDASAYAYRNLSTGIRIDNTTPVSLENTFTTPLAGAAPDSAGGSFNFAVLPYDGVATQSFGFLSPSTVRISAVPDAPTWVSLIAGLASIGLIGRLQTLSNGRERRRRQSGPAIVCAGARPR